MESVNNDTIAFIFAVFIGLLVALFFPVWMLIGAIYIPVKVALKAYNDLKE